MKQQELISELDKISEITKNHNKMIHLFSEDEGKRALANLNQLIGRVKMLLKAQNLKEVAHPTNKAFKKPLFGETGNLVLVRPCAEEYKDKTFLGFLVGSCAFGSSWSISDDKIQLNFSDYNPAIFVPELKKIVYGFESWWGEIETEEDFKKISDQDINNTWYVKLWKEMNNLSNTNTDKDHDSDIQF